MSIAIETSWRTRLGANRWLMAVECALVAGVFLADSHHDIYLSKTPYLLVLGWSSLALRGRHWSELGVSIPADWQRMIVIGVAVGVAMELLELFVTQPLLAALTGKYPDLSELKDLVGNIPMLLIAVGASWCLAALGEELAWRGYILNRALDLTGRTRFGWAISIAVVSVVFGLAHSSQNLTGIVENSIDGGFLALLYLACGRNLLAPIAAHGIADTIDSVIIFSGHYPGMH